MQTTPQRSAADTKNRPIILRAAGIRKSFSLGDAIIDILRGVDLTIREGEFVAIEGRSGSGKSTLLHILGALETVDDGKVEFAENDYTRYTPRPANLFIKTIFSFPFKLLTRLGILVGACIGCYGLTQSSRGINEQWLGISPTQWGEYIGGACLAFLLLRWLIRIYKTLTNWLRERPMAKLRNRDFGFVFQFYFLLPELNVLENAMLAAMVEHSWFGFKLRRSEFRRRAIEVLEQLGMGHRIKHKPNQLSGGERQRVAIARALMNNPKVLFADEPTGNLDFDTGRQIMDVLEKLHRTNNQTIVMVTHDRAIARQADRVLVLKDGKLERAE